MARESKAQRKADQLAGHLDGTVLELRRATYELGYEAGFRAGFAARLSWGDGLSVKEALARARYRRR